MKKEVKNLLEKLYAGYADIDRLLNALNSTMLTDAHKVNTIIPDLETAMSKVRTDLDQLKNWVSLVDNAETRKVVDEGNRVLTFYHDSLDNYKPNFVRYYRRTTGARDGDVVYDNLLKNSESYYTESKTSIKSLENYEANPENGKSVVVNKVNKFKKSGVAIIVAAAIAFGSLTAFGIHKEMQNRVLEKTNKTLENQLDEKNAENQALARQYLDALNEIEDLEQAIANSQDAQELLRLQEELEEAQLKYAQAVLKGKVVENELEELQGKYDALNLEYESLKVTNSSLNSQVSNLKSELATLKANYNSLLQKYQTLQNYVNNGSFGYDDSALTEATARIAQLEADKKELETKYANKVAEYNTLLANYKAEVSANKKLENENSKLEQENDKLENENAQLTQENKNLSKTLSELETKYESAVKEIQSLKEQLANASSQEEIKSLKEQIAKLEAEKQSLEAQYGNALNEIDSLKQEIENLNAQLESAGTDEARAQIYARMVSMVASITGRPESEINNWSEAQWNAFFDTIFKASDGSSYGENTGSAPGSDNENSNENNGNTSNNGTYQPGSDGVAP